jgi:hypothetical protein
MGRRITLDQRTQQIIHVLKALGEAERYDANETAMFSRQLEFIDQSQFDVLYPIGHAIELMPLMTGMDPGAESYTYRAYDYTGRAERVTNYGSNPPRVDANGVEVTTKVHSYWDGYGWSIQDLRAAAFAGGRSLDQLRATAAREVLMRKLDENLWFGDSEVNITGIANNALVDAVSVITGGWTTATADQILADITKLLVAASLATGGVEVSDSLLLPVSRYDIIATKFIGDNKDKTVLDLLRKAFPNVSIKSSYRLETGDAARTGVRAIAYTNDKKKLEGLVPMEFEQFAPQAKNMDFSVTCHMRAGGVAIRYPGSVKYMDSI